MDIKRIASRLGLEEGDIYDALEMFIRTAPDDLMKMITGYNKQDTVQVGEAAHSLKGSAGILGFMDISNHAQIIMEQCRENKFEDLTQTVSPFLNQMTNLLLELKEVLKSR
jgi:HPt (histidine-containing phosphotransfer) domain-containing protein